MLWDPFSALPSLRRWLWIFFAIAACVAQGPDFVRDLQPSVHEGVDFIQEWLSAKNYWSGLPIYASHRTSIPQHLGLKVKDETSGSGDEVVLGVDVNAHPPTSVLLVLPLGALTYPTATLVWNLLSLAALAISLWLLSRHLNIHLSYWAIFPLVTVLLVCSPFRQQMSQGQLNLILLLLLTVTWGCSRTDHPIGAGICLGLATAIKLFPGFLFLHFAVLRQGRMVVVGLITLAVTTLVTISVLGLDSYISFARNSLLRSDGFYSDWGNSSVIGLFYKLFDPSDEHFRTIPLWHSPLTAKLAGVIACLLIVLIWWRTIVRARSLEQQDFAYGISITTMLLLSPLSWDHYFVLLTIPLAMVWVRLPQNSWAKSSFVATLIVLFLPPVAMWNAWIPGRHPNGVAAPIHTVTVNSYGLYGLIALYTICALTMRCSRTADKADGPT